MLLARCPNKICRIRVLSLEKLKLWWLNSLCLLVDELMYQTDAHTWSLFFANAIKYALFLLLLHVGNQLNNKMRETALEGDVGI